VWQVTTKKQPTIGVFFLNFFAVIQKIWGWLGLRANFAGAASSPVFLTKYA